MSSSQPGTRESTEGRGDNPFTATVAKVMAEHRPMMMASESFPRLVRSLELGSPARDATETR